MFGWFKSKTPAPSVLSFKSTDAAFEYAAEYMRRPLIQDGTIYGQIRAQAPSELAERLGRPQKSWIVRLASEHGIVETSRCGSIAAELIGDLKLKSPPVQIGDLVAIRVGAYDPKYAIDSPMQYFVIMCKLKPEVRIEDHVFLPDIEREA